jgi:hypothetical protein
MSRNPTCRTFISYRRDDTAAYAGRLYDRLVDHFGESQVFMDVDSIEPGDDFIEAIRDAVGTCDVLLVLIGGQWLTSVDSRGQRRIDNSMDFVHVEIEAALERNVRIVPILVDRTEMPIKDDLPSALKALARRQAYEISHSQFRTESAALIERLEKAATSREAQISAGSSSIEKPQPTSDWRLVEVKDEGFTKTIRVARNEVHEITHTLTEKNEHKLAVDDTGRGLSPGKIAGLTGVRWTFYLVDAEEFVQQP